jgi:predicted Zn-dependent peptidase
MQGTKIRLLTGGLLMMATVGYVQAEALQPDPAWQQGTLANGFQWQVLATPQRPSDRIEVRLSVNIGSLSESTQQSGFSHFIPRLALTQNGGLPTMQARSLWQQSIDPKRPLPPAIVSYDYSLFNLSIPNNRNDLLKEALSWLASASGKMSIPGNRQPRAAGRRHGGDLACGYQRRLVALSAERLHHAGARSGGAAEAAGGYCSAKEYYHKWYTPDAMTLIVVGNVDSRSVAEQINKTFGGLKGKRETPVAVPTLSPLPTTPVSIMTDAVRQDKLSLMWDAPWQPIRDSVALQRYWRDDLAREALFWHVQQNLSKSNIKDIGLGFDCRVLYQRAQCAINIESPGERLNANLTTVARELAKVRDRGLPQEEFDALIAQKNLELQKLFATYARTDTYILISQRMRSLQNQVVDIAPEQYQKLRQEFLNSLTVDMLNQYLRQQLSQDMALVLQQPQGEPEYNMKELQATWEKLMAPAPAAAAASSAAGDVVEGRNEATDIPPAQ